MPTNIVISLDKRRKKKDETYPMILRLSHNRKTLPLSLDFAIHQKYWDNRNRKVKGTFKGTESVTRLNNLFEKKKAEAINVITKLEDSGELDTLSIRQVRDRVTSSKSKISFFTFTDNLIESLIKAKRHGTAKSYLDVKKYVYRFTNQTELLMSEVNYDFLKRMDTSFLAAGNTINGLAVYMRTIRAIYNKAIKEGYVTKEHYPFDHYKVRTTPTKKRTLSVDSINKIKELHVPENHLCFHARNYFMASFYMMGISFIDLAFLQVKNIVDGRIRYERKKTHKPYDIKINEPLQEILTLYMAKKEKKDFVFPILIHDELGKQYKRLAGARKRYNKKLKILAEMAGIDENLTSYVSRHTFASLANNKGIPVSAISEMLGHDSLKTTQVYLDSLSKRKLDEYNASILD